MDDKPPPLIPLPVSIHDSHSRLSCDTTQILTKFPKNPIINSTAPLSFETYPEDINTIPLIREQFDSCFFYIDTHSLVEIPDEPSFPTPLASPLNSTKTFRKNMHPTKFHIPIVHVFTTLLKNLSEKSNLLHQYAPTPSAIQVRLQKEILFDIPNLQKLRTIKNNPNHFVSARLHNDRAENNPNHLLTIDLFQNPPLPTQFC